MSQSYSRCKITILVRSFNPVILHDCFSSLCCLPSLGTVSRQKNALFWPLPELYIFYVNKSLRGIGINFCWLIWSQEQQNLSEFFSSTILALASRFLRVGGLKRRFGRKKVQEMDFCQNCSHISGPPSARQYGTVRQGNLSFGRFLLTLSGIKRSQVMCLENCSLLTS